MQTTITTQLYTALHTTFKFNEFRPGQLEALTTLMSHGRLLCIQPTGHGKSLLYQLPATLLDGVTLVISPLLALMRDQLLQLKNRFQISAASINTDQTDEENRAAEQDALAGKIRILFIAPEQLDHVDRFKFLLKLPIKLLVVDEAHCISTWGHDFRPSYRQIIKLAYELIQHNADIKLLALTATASKKTEDDIKQQLSVNEKSIILHRESMNRPNIHLSVIPVYSIASKLAALTHLLPTLKGTGLIYCATRENTQIAAEYLISQGLKATAYHAGLETQKKLQIQKDFLEDQYQVIAATNALGMGIDKSNLRFVIHFDFPGSITAYYQEVGRCGRDGMPAQGILLYHHADRRVQQHFIDSAQPRAEDFQLVLNTIISSKISLSLMHLKRLTGLHPTRLSVVIAELMEQGFLEKISRQGQQIYQHKQKTGSLKLTRYLNQFTVRTKELCAMQRYAAQDKKCLMVVLRRALGDKKTQSCNQCGVCTKTSLKLTHDKNLVLAISAWLDRRTVPIILHKKINYVAAGLAVLDGRLRSPDFIHFMRERTQQHEQLQMPVSLMSLIKQSVYELHQHHQFACIISLPSRTWNARHHVLEWLAEYINIPGFSDVLHWQEEPLNRQGELLNNDQRQFNVHQRMRMNIQTIPKGPILLLDDYTGSGATLNEAARTLREKIDNFIVPFTIAAVKWHLGKKGMV